MSISLQILYAFLIAYSSSFFFFFFFKTLLSAKKVPAVAVNCAMTTTEVLRVIVVAGTGYKTIKHLVLVSTVFDQINLCGVNLSNDVH